MTWITRDAWVPDEWVLEGRTHGYDRLIKEDAAGNHPALIATFHQNIGWVHEEIEEEQPDHAVEIVRIGQALYGRRARSIEIRHAHLRNERDRLWWDHAQCRVAKP